MYVCCAHCTCIAGLGKTCSLIAAILSHNNNTSPNVHIKRPTPPHKENNFSAPKSRRVIDNAINDCQTTFTPASACSIKGNTVPEEERMENRSYYYEMSGTNMTIYQLPCCQVCLRNYCQKFSIHFLLISSSC